MKRPGRDNKTAVVVGTITDDTRIYKVPKMKVLCYFTYNVYQLIKINNTLNI